MSDMQFDAYVDFLLQTLDRACIIFNVRRAQDVVWRANPFKHQYIQNCEARFERSMRRHPTCTFKVEYDRYVEKPDNLQPLFAFLGAEFDRETIVRVLATPHSLINVGKKPPIFRSVLIATLEITTRWLRRRGDAAP